MKNKAPERIWIEEDDCPYFYVESELADAGSPVTEYVRADKLEAEPVVQAKFETVADGIIGTRSVDVKRVEREDDDSLTVVIDYWPTPSPEATALKAENKRLREVMELARAVYIEETKRMITVMQAYIDGKKIEETSAISNQPWVYCEKPEWDWLFSDYRVAPDNTEKEGDVDE